MASIAAQRDAPSQAGDPSPGRSPGSGSGSAAGRPSHPPGRGRGRGRGRDRRRDRPERPCCAVCGAEDGKYKCPRCRQPYCSVACCKKHKTECQRAAAAPGGAGAGPERQGVPASSSASSRYLPSDALTAEMVENAVKRRRMLEQGDDDDSGSDLEEAGWKITREMMDRLDGSAWLRGELADGGLRLIISEVDCADDSSNQEGAGRRGRNRPRFSDMGKIRMSAREVALERARRTNPTFSGFLDRLLLLAGVLTSSSSSSLSIEAASLGGIEALFADAEGPDHLTLAPVPRRSAAPAAKSTEASLPTED